MTLVTRVARLAVVAMPAMLLMACQDGNVAQLDRQNLAGADFNHELARNYKAFADSEAYRMYDWIDAVHFANKGLAASSGQAVQPEDPARWKIRGDDKMTELKSARGRLMNVMSKGAATTWPAIAAKTQVDYDCWVEQQEEAWQFDDIAACRDSFYRSLVSMETTASPPSVAQQMPPATQAQRQYIVFFDWDKSIITADARNVLDAVANQFRNTRDDIHLVGHADRSGPDGYNMRLSERRAKSVEAYLESHGIARTRVTVEWKGERQPLVSTADGVREPQNRRVSIALGSQAPGA